VAYVFYDTETTGTETAFDQILQFAAIRTDADFNEIETLNIRCRLHPHVVPSPGALLVTGVRPQLLNDPSLPSHYEAIRKIRAKLLEWSPAIFLGYNSIKFDEDLLRQALFQTLHPAYLTNTKGNARGDVMRVAHAAAVYEPGSIAVPLSSEGKETFRLEQLAPANGFPHLDAHDALADVRATIHVAKLLHSKAPEVWTAMLRTSRKSDAADLVHSAPIVAVTERHGTKSSTWLVSACGINSTNPSQIGVFDLAFDPTEYLELSVEELIKLLSAKTKVIRTVSTNRQPIVMPASAAPAETKAAALPLAELQTRAKILQDSADFQARISEALSKRFADKAPSPHTEQRIYDGFASRGDEVLMEKFHLTPWEDRPSIVDQITDCRFIEFGRRLIYFEQPSLLDGQQSRQMEAWMAARINTSEDVPWMTIPRALAEADELMETSDVAGRALLNEVKVFLGRLAAQHDQPV
jgi:exodeoxyribonuclease-1